MSVLEALLHQPLCRSFCKVGTVIGLGVLFSCVIGCPVVVDGLVCESDADCDDGDVCTADACREGGDCENPAIEGCCESDDDCPEDEVCDLDRALCVAVDGCEVNSDCDDGDPCSEDTCADGLCMNTDVVCQDDGDPCTIEACDEVSGACETANVECGGGLICNPDSGECEPEPECAEDEDCDDDDVCTTDSCGDGQCVADAIAGCCNIDEDCAADQTCVGNTCVAACDEVADCNDGDACTADDCVAGGCASAPIEGCCDADEECAPNETCVANNCIATCLDDSDCNDGLYCTGTETCLDGVCQPGTDPCGCAESCSEGSDSCLHDDLCFTLDIDNLTGSTCDDIFNAPLMSTGSDGPLIPSLQTGDSADGLAGTDTLNATFNLQTASTVVATLTGIETFNLTNFCSFGVTMPATSITDLTKVCSVNSVNDIFLTSLASNTGACLDGLADAGVELNLAFLTGASTNPFTGTTDNLAVTIQNTSAGEVDVTTATNGFETVSIESSGTSANTLSALVVSGGSTTLLSATFTGDVALNAVALPATLTTYDASAMTGDLTLGSGTDDTTYAEFANPASNFVQITGGSGDDAIIFEDILSTTDFSTGTLDLGDGTDVVQNSFAATFGAPSRMRNVEEARFNATTSGISHNFSGWTGLEMITIEEDGTANTFTLTSIPATSGDNLPTLNYRGDNSMAAQTYDTITYGAASASGSSDSLTISVGNRGTNLNTGSKTTNEHIIGGLPFTVANIETINIDVADGPVTFNGLTASTLVTLDVDAPTSNTGTNVTMGTVAATGTTIQTVDASGVTGDFSATVNFAAATVTISTGPGNDTITIGQNSAAMHNSTVTLGDGNDTFTGDMSTAGTDSVTAGTGNDTITAGPGVDTITTGAGQDTINMDNSDTNEAAIDTVSDFTAGTGGDIVKFDVTSLEARDTDGGGADDLIDYATATIAGTETFNINLVTADGETMVAGDDLAVIDDDLVTFANMAAYIAATTATVDFVGGAAFATEDIVLLAYSDGSGNTRIGICGDAGGGGGDTDACDAGEDVLILSGVDVDNLVNGNFSWQP